MEPTQISPMLTPIIQAGFAGMCAAQLGVIVWMFSTLVRLQNETNGTIAKNSQVISTMLHDVTEQTRLLRVTRDIIIQRPCIAHFTQSNTEDAT